MTEQEKSNIKALREQGVGYRTIAQQTGVCAATVKTFCQRNGLGGIRTKRKYCKSCGKPLQQVTKRNRNFCSKKCSYRWWRYHTKKEGHTFVCPTCGKTFIADYGRKYCSHPCYIKARFGGSQHGQEARP